MVITLTLNSTYKFQTFSLFISKMEWIPLLPIELRVKIYRYVVWANAKKWKSELVFTWAKHHAIHCLQNIDNHLDFFIEDVLQRNDLTSDHKSCVLGKFNIVQQRKYHLTSSMWAFSLTDANLNDIGLIANIFARSRCCVFFKYMELMSGYSYQPLKRFKQRRIRGIALFPHPISMTTFYFLIGHRVRAFKIDDGTLLEHKEELDSWAEEKPQCKVSAGELSLWEVYS